MKKVYNILIITVLLLGVAIAVSCKPSGDEGIYVLKLKLSSTSINYAKANLTLTITTDPPNAKWTANIAQNGDWCTISPTSGTNAFVEIKVSENTTDMPRKATITVTSGDLTKTVELTQNRAKAVAGQVPFALELPEIRDTSWFIQHWYYAMEYDTGQRHSLWVAYVFNNDYNKSGANRSDAWAYDPIIPHELQWAWPYVKLASHTYEDFPTFRAGNTYNRGHLIASADRLFNTEANVETFYASNMSPQNGTFNSGLWGNLEKKVRQWAAASDCDTLYVVTGGAVNPGVEVIGTHYIRNYGFITVPKYYYKALVKRKGDTFTGIAWWMENKAPASETVTYSYALSIRELEQRTKINFFPNLKYALSGKPNLEEEVETGYDVARWPL